LRVQSFPYGRGSGTVRVSKRFLNIKFQNAVSERRGFATIVLTMFNVAPVDAAIYSNSFLVQP
jgi:hypothetical protein